MADEADIFGMATDDHAMTEALNGADPDLFSDENPDHTAMDTTAEEEPAPVTKPPQTKVGVALNGTATKPAKPTAATSKPEESAAKKKAASKPTPMVDDDDQRLAAEEAPAPTKAPASGTTKQKTAAATSTASTPAAKPKKSVAELEQPATDKTDKKAKPATEQAAKKSAEAKSSTKATSAPKEEAAGKPAKPTKDASKDAKDAKAEKDGKDAKASKSSKMDTSTDEEEPTGDGDEEEAPTKAKPAAKPTGKKAATAAPSVMDDLDKKGASGTKRGSKKKSKTDDDGDDEMEAEGEEEAAEGKKKKKEKKAAGGDSEKKVSKALESYIMFVMSGQDQGTLRAGKEDKHGNPTPGTKLVFYPRESTTSEWSVIKVPEEMVPGKDADGVDLLQASSNDLKQAIDPGSEPSKYHGIVANHLDKNRMTRMFVYQKDDDGRLVIRLLTKNEGSKCVKTPRNWPEYDRVRNRLDGGWMPKHENDWVWWAHVGLDPAKHTLDHFDEEKFKEEQAKKKQEQAERKKANSKKRKQEERESEDDDDGTGGADSEDGGDDDGNSEPKQKKSKYTFNQLAGKLSKLMDNVDDARKEVHKVARAMQKHKDYEGSAPDVQAKLASAVLL